uniref:Zinc finger protein 677 n=1 Tax=Ceratitis capitata TaxID=7213 RepID=W8CB23_CERCA
MLKVLPSSTFCAGANAKCGEIYCHSSTEFTIVCTLCELKAFDYEDFMLHCKNVHFENDLLRTEEAFIEMDPYLASNVKNEVFVDDNSIEVDYLDDPVCEMSDEEVEERTELRIMTWSENNSKTDVTESEEENNIVYKNDDEEYAPPNHCHKKKVNSDHQIESHKCELCARVYKSLQNLRNHMEKAHNPIDSPNAATQSQKCDECALDFKTLRSLEQHCLAEHDGMKCMYCDRRCTSRTNQLRHMETHTRGTERKFVCDYENCKKSFFTRRQYQAHKRTHTKGKNFICDICGYSCRVPEMLKVHYRSHTGEKPYACDECGKCFISKSAVREHKQSHGTERPHVCKVCGRSFARAKSLYHHNFLHLDEKKFKCRVCGQAYAQLAGLAGHMRRHREEGPC